MASKDVSITVGPFIKYVTLFQCCHFNWIVDNSLHEVKVMFHPQTSLNVRYYQGGNDSFHNSNEAAPCNWVTASLLEINHTREYVCLTYISNHVDAHIVRSRTGLALQQSTSQTRFYYKTTALKKRYVIYEWSICSLRNCVCELILWN